MYYILYGVSMPSLLIESTDSMMEIHVVISLGFGIDKPTEFLCTYSHSDMRFSRPPLPPSHSW